MTTSGNRADAVWETHAEWWRDEFTGGADDEYEHQMLPLVVEHAAGCRQVLDIGTGEGQVARSVLGAGARTVIGIDRAAAMVALAVARSSGRVPVARADVAALPFADSSFDAVTTCLVLEHVDDLPGALAEIARVLRPGGRFLLFLNHPAFQTPDSGWIDDHILEEQYWRTGPYLREQTTFEHVDADVSIPFRHRPLSRYINLAAANGLLVTHMEEPAPPVVDEYPEAATIPRLLFLRIEKVA